jgi:NAD(P)-dependent dehydrogenase (short-subunit alcohol dehydrogenase family)
MSQRMSQRNEELAGKVAIVTGAAAGIGAETARLLAQCGANVVLAGPAGERLTATAAALRGAGLQAVSYAVDIADEASVQALIAFTVKTFGGLHILDNNAAATALAGDGDVMSMSVEVWDRIMGVNARGTMLMCKHALPAMIESGGGSIINISSGTSTAGDMQFTAYAASKGAINTLTRYIATQYGHKNIRCNALALGLVRTEALEAGLPAPFQTLFAAHNLPGRIGEPRDIAEMVLFLASDRSPWITGQVLPVDGGFFAHVPTTVAIAEMVASMQPAH